MTVSHMLFTPHLTTKICTHFVVYIKTMEKCRLKDRGHPAPHS